MLKKQLYSIFITTLLIPIILIGSYLLVNNYKMMYGYHQDMLQSDNLRIRSIIFEVTTSITNICDIIAEDEDVKDMLAASYDSDQAAGEAMDVLTLLDDIFGRYAVISSVSLYTDNPTVVSKKHLSIVDESNSDWFFKAIEEPGYTWETRTYTDKYDNVYNELQLLHPIALPQSEYKSLLVISISDNYLKNRIDNNSLDVDLTVNDHKIFYSSMGHANENLNFRQYEENPFFTYSGIDAYWGNKELIEVSAIKPIKTDSSIYIFSIDSKAVDRMSRMLKLELLIVAMSIIIPTSIIIYYSRQLSRRVVTLRTEMHRVTDGDYDIIDTFKGNDELKDLFDDLKIMISSIKERDQKIFEGHLEEALLLNHQRAMEFELLSSKINPHFLYNTLETIRMKALASGEKDLALAVRRLGQYMRYNLESSGEKRSLHSELEYIQIYLDIQRLRFGNRIDYAIEVEPGIDQSSLYILPLLIQPLVENALLHGLVETLSDGMIIISCALKEASLVVTVKDNGCGMTEERLETVLNKVNASQNDKKSFGLYNIQQRLILTYGKKSMLQFETSVQQGTTIKFEIPLRKLRKE